MFSLPVPISLRSAPSQLSSIRHLLQLDSIPYFQCLLLGSGSAAVTYTGDLTTPNSCAINGSGKHGPLGFNVPSLPQVKVLLEVVYKVICSVYWTVFLHLKMFRLLSRRFLQF